VLLKVSIVLGITGRESMRWQVFQPQITISARDLWGWNISKG
jgi:hypothetical protein